MIKAEMVADSINIDSPNRDRISTMKVVMPRFLLAEFNTHRAFSRNSASSRAIPFKKMLQMVEENPFIPIAWQKDHTGMQGTEYLSSTDGDDSNLHLRINSSVTAANKAWLTAKDQAVTMAFVLNTLKATKQICNRLLEPFMWHTVLVTATEWENFFALRCPQYSAGLETYRSRKDFINAKWDDKLSDIQNKGFVEGWTETDWLSINKGQAEIHIMAVAEAMWDCLNESKPRELKAGEWHIPFGDQIYAAPSMTAENGSLLSRSQMADRHEEFAIKVAVARCARISYQTLDEVPKTDYEADIKLHDRLAVSGHWSPFEHVAQAMSSNEYYSGINGIYPVIEEDDGSIVLRELYPMEYRLAHAEEFKDMYGWSGNFRGFLQYRKTFPNENITR